MRYVDNLLTCKPEEIQYHDCTATIAAIVSAPDAVDEYNRVVIVWSEGYSNSYSVDGKFMAGCSQNFIYRSKNVQRLKPLHVILAEHEYEIVNDYLVLSDGGTIRMDPLSKNKGIEQAKLVSGGWRYPDSFFEEVEE